MSQKIQTRPSDLLGLVDPLVRYYFDKAIWTFGSLVEADLHQVDSKSKNPKTAAQKRRMVLQNWIPAKQETVKGRFKDPALRMR